jgi:ABC-2 type transport system ATP-binding protein
MNIEIWRAEMGETSVILTRKLTKYYGKHRGVENLNLDVQKGEIFGFLGPNGAGKTTTIRLLLGLIRATSGEATVLRHNIQSKSEMIREQVSYLPGELGIFKDWTAKRTLAYLFKLYDRPIKWATVEELAQVLNLDLRKKTRELSRGNKQKIGIVSVLAPDVELLILDEPTSGLDPLMNNEFYKLLTEKQATSGCTVFLSSHQLQEVEKIAHRVGIIRQGTIVEVAAVAQLKQLALKHVELSLTSSSDAKALAGKLPEKLAKNLTLEDSHARFLANREELAHFLPQLNEVSFSDINIRDSTLEDIFLECYGAEANGKLANGEIEDKIIQESRKVKRRRLK